MLLNVNPYRTSLVLGNGKRRCTARDISRTYCAAAVFASPPVPFTKSTRCRPSGCTVRRWSWRRLRGRNRHRRLLRHRYHRHGGQLPGRTGDRRGGQPGRYCQCQAERHPQYILPYRRRGRMDGRYGEGGERADVVLMDPPRAKRRALPDLPDVAGAPAGGLHLLQSGDRNRTCASWFPAGTGRRPSSRWICSLIPIMWSVWCC